jgi:hypothetical protein
MTKRQLLLLAVKLHNPPAVFPGLIRSAVVGIDKRFVPLGHLRRMFPVARSAQRARNPRPSAMACLRGIA